MGAFDDGGFTKSDRPGGDGLRATIKDAINRLCPWCADGDPISDDSDGVDRGGRYHYTGGGNSECEASELRFALAKLSAPVPSPDGPDYEAAARALGFLRMEKTGNWIHPNYSDGLMCRYSSAEEIFNRELPELFSPSPAVAAEPVAWRTPMLTEGHQLTTDREIANRWMASGVTVEPLYASPPVRGDREAIALMLYECEKRRAELTQTVFEKASGKPCPGAKMEPWDECKDVFLSDADALIEAGLVVPVQPGAGERTYARGVKDADQMIGALWSDLFNKDLVKPEGADIFDKWRTRIRDLSRQATHSSSEGK